MKNHRFVVVPAALLALLPAAAAFAQGESAPAKPQTSVPAIRIRPQAQQPTAAPARPELLAPGTVAPDFTVLSPTGKEVKLSDMKGKVVVLDFWATWCGPCRASMPHLEKVYQAVKGQNVAVLAVCVSDTKDAYEKWLPENKTNYTFPTAFDPAARDPKVPHFSREKYNVSGIPTTYVIGADGKVVDAIVGFRQGDTRLEAALQKAGIKVEAQVEKQAKTN